MDQLPTSRVSFYWQPSCARSSEIRPALCKICADNQLALDEIDVSLYPETLRKRFGERTPAIAINGRARAWGTISLAWIEREIVAAANKKHTNKLMLVSAVIVTRRNKMLVNLRPEGTFYGGWWEWPGGKVEAGESAEAAALRELDEEIGIRVKGTELFDRRLVEYPERLIDLHVFKAQAKPLSRPKRGALKHRWIKPSALRQFKFLEPNIPVLERIIREGL